MNLSLTLWVDSLGASPIDCQRLQSLFFSGNLAIARKCADRKEVLSEAEDQASARVQLHPKLEQRFRLMKQPCRFQKAMLRGLAGIFWKICAWAALASLFGIKESL